MAFATKVFRPVRPPAVATREAYLGNRKFCNVLSDNRKYRWLTVVLGSGCSTSPEQVSSLASLVSGVKASLDHSRSTQGVDGTPLSEYVHAFLSDLIRDRARLPDGTDFGNTDRAQVPDWLVELALASALTSHLYSASKSLSPVAPHRSPAADEALLSPNSQALSRYLRREVVQPAQNAVKAVLAGFPAATADLAATLPFTNEAADDSLAEFAILLNTLLEGLCSQLGGTGGILRLRWSDVDTLAEIVWFCLTCLAEPGVYPGWTDLMLDLSCSVGRTQHGEIRVPTLDDLTRAGNIIRHRYLTSTLQAYERDRPPIYRAAAAVLSAEADFRRLARPVGGPPAATAFVTSFDLELEMALLDAHESFTLVVPAHLVSAGIAHTCWLSAQIDAEDSSAGLGVLLTPTADKWRVIDDQFVSESSHPIVVRLAGCPLVTLPGLGNVSEVRRQLLRTFDSVLRSQYGNDSEMKEDVENNLALHHAILLNEYDATWHNSLDLIDPVPREGTHTTNEGNSGLVVQRASLPATLVAQGRTARGTDNGKWRRFWFLLGVQMQESAVRHRMAALMSSVPMTVGGSAVMDVDRLGVAVNTRLASVERELLQWAGLDVVVGPGIDAANFAGDLEHYAAHVRGAQGQRTRLGLVAVACQL